MDPAILTALAALFGSLFGGAASVATTWITQHSNDRRQRINGEIRRRETLYSDFINECSKLILDSLDHSFDQPAAMVSAYAIFNRIRLVAGEPVVTAGDAVLRGVIESYFRENLTRDQIRSMVLEDHKGVDHDPLTGFSLACRAELDALQATL